MVFKTAISSMARSTRSFPSKKKLRRRGSDDALKKDDDQDATVESDDDMVDDDGSVPPFLPLEEEYVGPDRELAQSNSGAVVGISSTPMLSRVLQVLPSGKTTVGAIATSMFLLVAWDAMVRAPEDRWLNPDSSEKFLLWVQEHPVKGIVAILLVIAAAVVFMIPVGTPLTVGCGYIYKGAYGWKLGLTVATMVAMGGSALGAVTCFLLGRYLMREQVRKWIKKYPLFDAIDVGA
jgi:membrane protein YqaA with SNARE-associated domain